VGTRSWAGDVRAVAGAVKTGVPVVVEPAKKSIFLDATVHPVAGVGGGSVHAAEIVTTG
jgi:hypothetical protein